MPAKSKKQRRFMGMVHAIQKGVEIKGASKDVKKTAKTMEPAAVKKFASTPEKGLPIKKKNKKK